MQCIICNKEFEAKRSDAKFCSAKCRVKSGRTDISPPTPEKEKKAAEHCDQCTELSLYGHFCPNKDCGCWESGEEQADAVARKEKECDHPAALQVYSRCIECGGPIPYVVRRRETLSREFCKKHKGYRYQCGCKSDNKEYAKDKTATHR